MAQDHIARIIADTKQFDAKITASMRVLQSFNQYIHEVGAGNVTFSNTEKEVIRSMGQFETSAKTTEGAVKQLNEMLRELTNTYNKLDAETKASDVGKSMANSISQLQSRLKSAQADLKAMGGDVSAASGKGGGLFGKIMGGNLAARAIMDSLRFLKDTVKDAVKAQMEFEYSNATLSAVLGKTKEEIQDLTTQAQLLGATTLYSAKQISELQVVLGRLGFNKNEIKDSTDAIAKLALATGVDLNKAAELTGSTLRAFGYRTSEVARVASVLGVATTKSALDMEKLRTAMAYAASVARQAGFEIEDVVAMLGKMVDNGQQATTAGVNMRNIMLDLSNNSSKLSRAIKEVTGKDQVKNFDEFVDALRQMRDAGINLDDVANVVQKRVTPGFLNMIANTEGIAQLRDELKGCTGELDAMADKMEDTLKGSITKLGNAWDALMISFANSKGPLKQITADLANLLSEWAQARIAANANTPNVKPYESIDNKAVANNMYLDMRARGISNADIMKQAQSQQASYKAQADIYAGLEKKYDDFFNRSDWGEDAAWKLANEVGEATGQNINKIFKELMDSSTRQDLGKWLKNQRLGYNDYAIQQEMLYQNAKAGKADNGDIRGGVGLGIGERLRAGAKDGVESALVQYEIAIKEAALEYDAGKLNKKQYDQRILSAMESVFKAYGTAAATLDDPKYKQGFEEWAGKISEQAAKIAGDEHIDAVNKALQKYEQAIEKATLEKEAGVIDEIGFAKAQLAAQEALTKVYEDLALETNSEEWGRVFRAAVENTKHFAETLARLTEEANQKKEQTNYDKRILRGLQSTANRAKLGYDAVGLDKIGERIAQGVDISNEEWLGIQNRINSKLKGLNLDPIKIDFETGSIEKLKSDLNILKDELGQMSGIAGGLKAIKSTIEGIANAFDETNDPLDTFFALWESGFSLIQTGIAIYEAITKLQTISNALKEAHAAAEVRDTAVTLANAGAQATEASAAGAAAAAKGGKAVAGIPLIGPILAVAAIAAIAAAIAASRPQTEYHAQGGFVGMDGIRPKGTDVVPAMLTPGELVLNRAQQGVIASQLQGAGRQMVLVQGESYISGEQIKIVYNNYSKRRGVKSQLG